MKKVILVNTSPRKEGNCDKAMAIIAENLTDAEVEVFNLSEKEVNPCMACGACKAKDIPSCVQKDDMGALIEKIDDCDALVIASPIYFGAVNGPAKTFQDRLYCFFNPTKPNASIASKPGKKALMVLSAGAGPAEVYAEHGKAFIGSFAVVGATDTKVISHNGGNVPGEIWANDDNKAELVEAAKWLSE